MIVGLFGSGAWAAMEYAPTAGRGDTGVALPAGSLSLEYNAALLGVLFNDEVSAGYAQPDWQSLHQFYGAVSKTLKGGLNAGLIVNGMLFDDAEMGITRINGVIGMGKQLFPGGYGGFGVRVNYASTTLDQQQLQNVVEGGLDAGLLYKGFSFLNQDWLAPLALGLSIRNLVQMNQASSNQSSSSISISNVRIGLAYTLRNWLSFTYESGPETLNLGAEAQLTPTMLAKNSTLEDASLTLRAGLIETRRSADASAYFADLASLLGGFFVYGRGDVQRPSATFGATVSYKQFDLSYAGLLDPAMVLDHRFALGYRFGYESSYVTVADLQLRNLFSALSKSYAANPVGSLKLKNISGEVLQAEVGYFVRGVMDAPTTVTVVLRPKSERVVDLHAIFNDSIREWRSEKPVQAQVSLTYRYQNRPIQKALSKSFLLYDRNSITWDIPEQVMVFVTPKDPVIMEFSRKALEILGTNPPSILPPAFAKAMAVFNAVAAGGMTYVHSASGAFASDTSTRSAIDSVQYPRETLQLKAGKCGDTTVLYCSLLESIGIQTAFIDIPGHVYMMFNTEVPEASAATVSPNPADYVVRDGTVWVPVETTVWKDGFLTAWKEGMTEYRKWVKP